MARTITLGPGTTENTLIRRCQRRVDLVGDDFIPDEEWKAYISTAYAELYAVLVASGERYFETVDDFASSTLSDDSNGGGSVALPSDYLSTLAVDYQDGDAWRPLSLLQFRDHNRFSGTTGTTRATAYALIGANLHLYPLPPTGQTYRHIYVPQPADLSAAADATSVDVVTPGGEEFVIAYVAVLAKEKEESDTTAAERARDRAYAKLEKWATLRRLDNSRARLREGELNRRADDDPASYGY